MEKLENFAKTTSDTKQMLSAANNNNTSNTKTTQQSAGAATTRCWESCYYCPCESFKTSADFVKHLRERHCTREGGSYVCRYGFNGVCPSLPLDGVSDRDYDAHVSKYHVNQHTREMPPEWSVFSAAQNLPAVLNDPSRGKQSNLFTKKWGDSFVDKTHIPTTAILPDITYDDFEKYIAKIGKRFRRHEHLSAQQAKAEREREDYSTPTAKSMHVTTNEQSLDVIPDIFLKENFNLNHAPTFAQVFPGIGKIANSNKAEKSERLKTSEEYKKTSRLLQEQLSQYLDIVEVKIAHQVSQKSQAFFHAMTSQDAIMSEMQEAAENVRQLRASLKQMDSTIVLDSLRILRFAQRRQNYDDMLDKLSLMATVHKTQPMLQLLLGTQDYVAALDLIGTTQEILSQELIGVHCFKHLPMQLNEMEKLIDKMLTTEFERYATTDLNRPLSDVLKETDSVCAEEDKLVCIVMGLLRMKNFNFVSVYKEEAIATIRAIIKQLVIEVIATSDAEVCLTGAGEEAQSFSISEWIALLKRATIALLTVLQRIRAVTAIMQQTVNAAAGQNAASSIQAQAAAASNVISSTTPPAAAVNLIDSEAFLTTDDCNEVHEKLQDLLVSVCSYCHERCANLVSTQSLERAIATGDEIEELTKIVDEFCNECEAICGVPSVPLKVAVKVQASRFANRFHTEHKQKLALLLDSERWRQVDIPNEFQKIIERIAEQDFITPNSTKTDENLNALLNGHSSASNSSTESVTSNHTSQASPVLLVEGKPYALVGAALLLVQMLREYCCCAARVTIVAGFLSRNVVDLLRTFNSRSCQLIIGAGAMRVAGLKTITSTNLALVSRALQLVLWLLPKLKAHFQSLEPNTVTGYETIERDIHSHIKEIENKIYNIVTERVIMHLDQWDARPPIPSQHFRNISRHFVKLHEAISPILPETQIHVIYGIVHRNFKDKLRERLLDLNIINNGGPQHGLVTSELIFYMETMRTLKALSPDELNDNILENIWNIVESN